MSKNWKAGMRRAPPGKSMIQMPMECYKFETWTSVIHDRLAEEVDKRCAAQAARNPGDRLSKKALQDEISHLFPAETLLSTAMSIHVEFYGRAASDETGIDLDMKPLQAVIGEPDGYAVLFATIKSSACERLAALEGVAPIVKQLTEIRRSRLVSKEESGHIDRSEGLMDLLVAAAPHTTAFFADYSLRNIVDLAVNALLTEADASDTTN